MKTLLLSFVFVIMILVTLASCSKNQPPPPGATSSVANRSSQPAQENNHMHEYAVRGRVPAYYTTPPDVATLPPTLSPALFDGNKRRAYEAAKEIPQTLAQLPCYCHCDRGQGHKSLHSCFESEHGENCGICIGEALMAHNLQKSGVSVSEIRNQIIHAYGEP